MRRIGLSALLLLVLAVGAACASKRRLPKVGTDPLLRERRDSTRVDDEAPLGRLPEDVIPLEYDLNLQVDPAKQTFSGFAAIGLRLTRPRSHLWIHGVGLQVKRAQVTLEDGSTRRVSYQQLTPSGVVRISFRSELEPQRVRLVIGYDAELGRSGRGAHRFEREGRSYVATYFAPIDARRAFPCLDEPRFKTPFRLTLTVPAELEAYSVSSVEAQRVSSDGTVRTLAFRETAALSTAEIGFVVGPFDSTQVELPPSALRPRPVLLRGLSPAGAEETGGSRLVEIGKLVGALEELLGFPYPWGELNLVAEVPVRGAAMVAFSPAPEGARRDAISARVAEDVARQWLGAWVTPAWWDDLWLARALPAWAVARVRAGDGARLVPQLIRAMERDDTGAARPLRETVSTPRDIRDAFERVDAAKAVALVSMIESMMGNASFRATLKRFLERYAGQSVGTAALFEIFAEESVESDEVLGGFLGRAGVPRIRVRTSCERGVARVDLRQGRYHPIGAVRDPDARWTLPVCVALPAVAGREVRCSVMRERELSFELDRCPAWVMPNAGARGYYRFTLDERSRAALVRSFESLTEEERLALIDSLLAAVYAGELTPSDFFESLREFASAESARIVEAIFTSTRRLTTELTGERIGVARYLHALFDSRAAGSVPEREDALGAALLRVMVFGALDARWRAYAAGRGRDLLDEGLAGTKGVEPAATWLGAALQEDGVEVFDRLIAALEGETHPRVRRVVLDALAHARSPELTERVRELLTSEMLQSHERLPLLVASSETEELSRAAFVWLRASYDDFSSRLPPTDRARTPWVARRLCSERDLASIDAFFADRLDRLPGGPRALEAVLDGVASCIAQRRALGEAVQRYLGEETLAIAR